MKKANQYQSCSYRFLYYHIERCYKKLCKEYGFYLSYQFKQSLIIFYFINYERYEEACEKIRKENIIIKEKKILTRIINKKNTNTNTKRSRL